MSLSTWFYRILSLSTFNFYIDLYHVVVEHFLSSVFIFGSVPKLIHLSYDSFILYESILFYISGGEEKLSLFIDISQNLISETDPSQKWVSETDPLQTTQHVTYPHGNTLYHREWFYRKTAICWPLFTISFITHHNVNKSYLLPSFGVNVD